MGKGSKKKNHRKVPSKKSKSSQPNIQSDQSKRVTKYESISIEGPLPIPQLLKQYDDIVPGSAERIISMAEKNQTHRHSLEKEVTLKGVRNESRAQWLAFILFLSVVIAGTYLIKVGESVTGFATLLLNAGTFIGLYLHSKKSKLEELRQKREELEAGSG